MLRTSLRDYSDSYILVSSIVTVPNTAAAAAAAAATNPNNRKNIIIKNCAPFTNCTSEINNTQIDNVKDINIAMPIYNLIEYSDNYSKTLGSLWQYYRYKQFLDNNNATADFLANNNNNNGASLKFKVYVPVVTLSTQENAKLPEQLKSGFKRTVN